jgi:hypothetical protein
MNTAILFLAFPLSSNKDGYGSILLPLGIKEFIVIAYKVTVVLGRVLGDEVRITVVFGVE